MYLDWGILTVQNQPGLGIILEQLEGFRLDEILGPRRGLLDEEGFIFGIHGQRKDVPGVNALSIWGGDVEGRHLIL